MENRIKLSDFILEKFTELKVPEQTLEVIFEKKLQSVENKNGQAKCKDLVFPFSRSPLKNVALKHFNVLLESKNKIQAKELVEIRLDFKDFREFDWQPGDTIAILPLNSRHNIVELLQLLDLESTADTICSVKTLKSCSKKTAKVPPYIPSSTTPREILRDCLNLKTLLKKTFLRSLAEYCADNEEKAFFKCLSSKEGSSFYNNLIVEKGFTLIDMLQLCPTCKPPFSLIIEHLTRLLPRPYSIANSPLKTNAEITVFFSIRDTNPGVTTSMLKEKSIQQSSSILIYLREPNYFRYTQDNYQENQILIAIGTGLAPFLGFLQHKQHLVHENKEKSGTTWLFVGTTSQQAVIYREVLLQWLSNNVINKFEECYSRDPGSRYHYVQESLEGNAKKLVELLMKQETILYLCADGRQISKSVEKSLQNIIAKELTITEEESIEMLKDFKAKRKYREDIWL